MISAFIAGFFGTLGVLAAVGITGFVIAFLGDGKNAQAKAREAGRAEALTKLRGNK